jgi:hypothetical protein
MSVLKLWLTTGRAALVGERSGLDRLGQAAAGQIHTSMIVLVP